MGGREITSVDFLIVYWSCLDFTKSNKFQKLSQRAFDHNIVFKQLQIYIFVFTCHRYKQIHEKMNSLAIKAVKDSLFVSVR